MTSVTSGRTQFQPAIAVDQATGTLVLSWRDARDDAANARVATYITASIDGGNTFNAQTYANPPQTAIDAITGQIDVLGPQPDNQSAGNGGQTDPTFGYGDQMGLAVFDGQVYPVWAGNFNQSYHHHRRGRRRSAEHLVPADGHRRRAADHQQLDGADPARRGGERQSVTISVTFDRPVSASPFVPGDVQVFYHDTTNGDPSVPLTVLGVAPVLSSGNSTNGYTQFTITFDPTPPGAAAHTTTPAPTAI